MEECILKLWYRAKNKPEEIQTEPYWKIRQLAGVLSELSWLSLFKEAGFDLETPRTLEFEGISGRPDSIASYRGSATFIIELKQRTGYTYKKYIERYSSVIAVEPSIYSQMQVYMEAAGVEWGLLFVSPADHSLLQKNMRDNKRWGPEYVLPSFHVEWIKKNPDHVNYLKTRIKKIKDAIAIDSPPAREYNGIPVGLNGKRTFPCGYCVFNPSCTKEFGYGTR